MRDPNRIDSFCDELKKVWHTVPDWRFGQLMSNFFERVMLENKGRDIFYFEDNEMLEALKRFFKTKEGSENK